jgi:hypothetical protein
LFWHADGSSSSSAHRLCDRYSCRQTALRREVAAGWVKGSDTFGGWSDTTLGAGLAMPEPTLADDRAVVRAAGCATFERWYN